MISFESFVAVVVIAVVVVWFDVFVFYDALTSQELANQAGNTLPKAI